jgi:hypothetical protein
MTETKHTPTPWYWEHNPNGHGPYVRATNGTKRKIAATWCQNQSPVSNIKQNEANAEFIVRACNAHDNLVAALDAAYGELLADDHRDGARLCLLSNIEKALSKAKAVQ